MGPSRPLVAADTLGRSLLMRIDRFPRWGLSPAAVITIGLGMLFVQYDIFNINVSFVQTCAQIVPGCTPATADQFIGLPVFLSLLGYAVGALVLGPLSDRLGRHRMLILAMVITGLGSLYSALSADYGHFSFSRLVTGIGIGADLAIINTYVNEVSPRHARARYTSLLFIMAALGAALGIWAGLLLTTPATAWPAGLPFAVASDSFTAGWRWIYGIGAILAVASLVLRINLPESPRWLILKGRIEEARSVVTTMEARATGRAPLLPEPRNSPVPAAAPHQGRTGVRELLTNPLYRNRLFVLSMAWMLGYLTVYAFSGALTTVLTRIGYSPAEAGMVSAIGLVGFIAAAIAAYFLTERIERKWWMLIGSVIAIAGGLVVSLGDGNSMWLLFLGAVILFFGQNIWIAPQYALTAESFPTSFRATGYALADSIGHIGGGLGVFLLVGALQHLPLQATMLALCSFMLLGSLVNLLAPRTRGRNLEDVSA